MQSIEQLRRMVVFAAVADAGGFAAAGRRLGMTRAAVSKQVATLEEHLGAQLFVRTTRSLSLTAAGERFLPGCVALAEGAEATWAEARSALAEPRGRLVVTAPLGIGERFVGPRLPSFLDRHPGVDVTLTLTDEVTDLVSSGVDVAVRAGRLPDSSLIARRIGRVRLVVAAAPDFADADRVRAPEDLTAAPWVTYTPLGVPNRPTFTGPDGATTRVRTRGRVATNNGDVIRRLLIAGGGVGLLPWFYIADDVAAGRLRTLLDDFELPSAPVYAVHAHSRRVPLPVRVFVDHLADQSGGSALISRV